VRVAFFALEEDAESFCDSESLTRFHSRSPPNISVLDYLRRIVKYTNVEVRGKRSKLHVHG
jgi:hypothetical protein